MANLTSVLNDEIRRLARKEISALTKEVEGLKRQIARLEKQAAKAAAAPAAKPAGKSTGKKRGPKPGPKKAAAKGKPGPKPGKKRGPKPKAAKAAAPKTDGRKARFSAKGLATHRKSTGLSAADYAKLAGCSLLSIYKWEKGESTPREAMRQTLAGLRKLGKKEAAARLAAID